MSLGQAKLLWHHLKSQFRVPFELTQGDGGRVVYALNYGGKDVQLTSEQITAALFTKLKEIGENALGTKVPAVLKWLQLAIARQMLSI